MGYGYGGGLGVALIIFLVLFSLYAVALLKIFRRLYVLSELSMPTRLGIAMANLVPLLFFVVEWNTNEIEMLSPFLLLIHLVLIPVILYVLKAGNARDKTNF